MLIHCPEFSRAYSYAINPASFKARNRSSKVDIIAFSVKSGIPYLTMGTLSSMRAASIEELKEAEDLGMNTLFKWDGRTMWSSENLFVKEMDAWKYLDALMRQSYNRRGFETPDLALAPPGYEGWYARK